MASAYRESRKDARILKIGNDERGRCLAYRVPTIDSPGEKAFEWISQRRGLGSEKKKKEKMSIVRGNFSGTELPSRVPGNDPPQAFSALYAIGKRALLGAFRCVGSNSLLWELFITRLMPRLEPGDLRNSALYKVERILSA